MSNFLVQGGAPPDDSVTTVKVKDDAVTTAKIANDQVTLAKMAGLARGTMIYGDASGDPAALAVGAADEVLTHDGTDIAWAAAGGGFTLGAEVATTTGSTVTLNSSIPAGTTFIMVNVEGLSLTTGNNPGIRIGDAGGIETTGYVNASAITTVTNGTPTTGMFGTYIATAGETHSGHFYLTLKDATNNTWICSHTFGGSSIAAIYGGGSKSLSAELTQIQLYTGGGAFDAGSINVNYM